MNKHTILKEWVNQFLEEKNLSFETIEMNLGARALVPNYGDYVVKTDVLGNKYKEYTFAFVGCELIDYGTSDVNENNMNLFDEFNEWIEEQERNKNYPDFGATEYKLEPLQNMANIAQYDESSQLAKYMLLCKISYTEKGE